MSEHDGHTNQAERRPTHLPLFAKIAVTCRTHFRPVISDSYIGTIQYAGRGIQRLESKLIAIRRP